MRQFDVLRNPNPATAEHSPFLVVLQSHHLDPLDTVFLALRVYSGRSAEEILATAPDYIDAISLSKHLSPTRSNGLTALLAFIQDRARNA